MNEVEVLDADGYEIPLKPQKWWHEEWDRQMVLRHNATAAWGRAYYGANLCLLAVLIAVIWVIGLVLKFAFVVVLALICQAIIGFFLGGDDA